jgi:hypothetical protein
MTEAPRWRLLAPHYLNVSHYQDGTKIEWEHKETNAINGRAVRKLFPVPLLLNTEDPNDFNYPGEIIVAQAVEGATPLRQDYIFTGAPTRDMEPLNPEAEAVSDLHRARWVNPIETLPANGGMNEQERTFMQTMMADFAKQVGASLPQGNASVPREDYDALRDRLAKLEALIMSQNKAPATTERRA